MSCSCGTVIDDYGDHILGCDSIPMRIYQHNSLREVIWHVLLQDHSGCRRENIVVLIWTILGLCFILIFSLVSQLTLMFLCIILYRIPCFVFCYFCMSCC